MYKGAPRRACQLPAAHKVEPKACTRRPWLPLYGACVISEHVGRTEISGHNTGIYSTVFICVYRIKYNTKNISYLPEIFR